MKILLAVDGSEVALKAVRLAIDMVREGLSATMVLANVQEPASLYEMVAAPDGEVLRDLGAAAGLDALQAAESLLVNAGVTYEREVASGDPANTIVDIAERFSCSLIMMGASAGGALREVLLGSVSSAVLHASRVPVTLVRLND